MTTHHTDPATADKRFLNLRAQLAMHGHVLHRTSANDGAVTYYCHKWGMVRHFIDLNAVDTFLKQVGGEHGC